MKGQRKVLVIVGPTGSGKTELSLLLARPLDGEILSADSRQVYRYLTIGTGKPSQAQLVLVRHHGIDERDPDEEFSAGEFGALGRVVIDQIFDRGRTPIVVGGSGLYIRSLVDGLFEGPGANREFRERMEARVRAGEGQVLLDELRQVDPHAAAHIDSGKPRRIIRALEVYHQTGRPISEYQRTQKITINFTPIMFGLMWARRVLYQRIEERCDRMLRAGFLHEVDVLERRGYDDRFNALKTVGYAEAFAYRRGEISYDEFVRLFKQNSRRYAKRQLTWFRRDPRIEWIQLEPESSMQEVSSDIVGRFAGRHPEAHADGGEWL